MIFITDFQVFWAFSWCNDPHSIFLSLFLSKWAEKQWSTYAKLLFYPLLLFSQGCNCRKRDWTEKISPACLHLFSRILKQNFICANTPQTRWNGECPAVTRGSLRWIRGSTWWGLESEGKWAFREEDEIHWGELKGWGLPWWRCAGMLSQHLTSWSKRAFEGRISLLMQELGEGEDHQCKGEAAERFWVVLLIKNLEKEKIQRTIPGQAQVS